MNDNAIQTALNATEEIDLTEFKLSKRTDNYGFTYVFEKKVSDWNVNDGKPIHCTADVCRLTCTDNGKIVFTLEIHNLEIHKLKNVDEIPARKVNIVNLPTIRR